jgi:hypothetical protein
MSDRTWAAQKVADAIDAAGELHGDLSAIRRVLSEVDSSGQVRRCQEAALSLYEALRGLAVEIRRLSIDPAIGDEDESS